jgi:LacI family transcriptional regulator
MSASIKDIAKALGMSISTVSLALNDKPRVSDETRALVKAKAKELNYVKNGIASDLQRKRTNIILFVVNDASRSFFSSIIKQLQIATANFGYDLIICTTYGDHLSTVKRFLQEHRADAAIIYTSTVPNTLIQEYATPDFPITVIGRKVEGDNIYSINAEPDAFSEVTQYLIDTGHKNIAFVKGSKVSLNTSRSFNQYKNTLEKNGISFNPNIVYDANGASYKHGYEITKEIIKDINKLDAIQYSTDDVAIGGLLCLKDSNIKVPEQISIAGNNNIPESALIYPGLTTYGSTSDDYPYYEGIVHYLITLIEKNENYENIAQQIRDHIGNYGSKSQLIIRESVKKR